MTGRWAASTRKARLPRDWPTRVATVKARARGKCEATTHVAECDGTGSECDHVQQGDDHTLTNLQWLSAPCHKAKTTAENAARRATLRLPREQHPAHSNRSSDDSAAVGMVTQSNTPSNEGVRG